MNRLLRPNVILPVILGAAVLAGLLAFSDVGRVAALVAGFRLRYLAFFAAILLAYEAVRWLQWHFMLGTLGVDVPLRTQIFTFMTGEAAKDLPAGNFVPNYLLQNSNGTDFGFASSVTLLITLIEVAVALATVVVVGIAGLSWLRPLILIGSASFALLAGGVTLWLRAARRHRRRTWRWVARWSITRRVGEELRQFARGEAQLLHPRVLAVASALSATYLTLGGAGVYLVARGLGIDRLGFWQLVAIYCFSIAFAAIAPLPMDFGSIEASGTGALVAAGIVESAAAGLMLFNRLLNVAFTLLFASIVWLVLAEEAHAALKGRAPANPPLVLQPAALDASELPEVPAGCEGCAA